MHKILSWIVVFRPFWWVNISHFFVTSSLSLTICYILSILRHSFSEIFKQQQNLAKQIALWYSKLFLRHSATTIWKLKLFLTSCSTTTRPHTFSFASFNPFYTASQFIGTLSSVATRRQAKEFHTHIARNLRQHFEKEQPSTFCTLCLLQPCWNS